MPDQVVRIANRLLETDPDPVPAYRIRKDLLNYQTDNRELAAAREQALLTNQVQTLIRQQSPVGSWGHRFFTRNKHVKNPAKTTETALIRLNALAVDADHDAVRKAADYMVKLLDGSLRWPDRVDPALQHDMSMRLVIAARLSEICPNHELVADFAEKIITIMQAAFSPGFFDEGQLQEASEDIFGIRLGSDCEICFSSYPLILLRGKLDYELESRWMEHLFRNRRGIYLINNRSLQHLPLGFPSQESIRYINAMDILSWYPAAMSYLSTAKDWLWDQIDNEGFWDLGHYGRDGLELPLSDSWRSALKRQVDSSLRVLTILSRLQQTCSVKETLCHPL